MPAGHHPPWVCNRGLALLTQPAGRGRVAPGPEVLEHLKKGTKSWCDFSKAPSAACPKMGRRGEAEPLVLSASGDKPRLCLTCQSGCPPSCPGSAGPTAGAESPLLRALAVSCCPPPPPPQLRAGSPPSALVSQGSVPSPLALPPLGPPCSAGWDPLSFSISPHSLASQGGPHSCLLGGRG